MSNFNSLAVIPARGCSKGIPRKNLRLLGGIPLVAHSIILAQEAKCFDRIIVSTEDAELAEIAIHYGAEVPFLRPVELAGDKDSVSGAENHLLSQLAKEGFHPDFCTTLYPTHPFRTPALLAHLVNKGREGYSPVLTVREIVTSSDAFVRCDADGNLSPIVPSIQVDANESRWYRPYGYFTGKNPGVNDRPFFHVLKEPLEWIDIDTFNDLALAEEIIRNGLNVFKYAA
ncbi:MAG: acylneuraminate cytidylyltransferase family protein [Pseudodesulfovibrio sp.]|nr:acylneuraminate cytidylyltransferase family protein [Pseudodesulfovibrio sp.]